MSRYRKIDVRLEGDEKFRRLTPSPPCGQTLWLRLLISKRTTNIPGLFEAGEATMAEDLGWSVKGFRKAFAEVEREGMAKADWSAKVVWVPNALKYNPPESPNVVRAWRHTWDEIAECDLKREAWLHLRSRVEGLGEGFAKAFREACPKPFGEGFGEGSRQPLANQEQEQEQEVLTDSLRSSGAVAPAAAGKDEQVGSEGPVPSLPTQLDLVTVKKLTPHQQAVEAVLALYAEVGVEAPAPSLIVRWRSKLGDTDKLLDTLHHLADAGHLAKGTGYVAATVTRVAAGEAIGGHNGQAHPAGPRPVPAAAEPYPSTPHGAVDAATGEFYDAPSDTWRPPLRGDVRRNGKVYDGAGWVDSLELAS